MEIQKIFSSYDDYGYEDERIYSVLMGEDELRMFTGAVKKANKILKNAWQMEKGEKALMNQGVKKYVSKGYRTELNPEFSPERILEKGRSIGKKAGAMKKYREASINDRINAKANLYLYKRGKAARGGINSSHPWYYDDNTYQYMEMGNPMKKLSDTYISASPSSSWKGAPYKTVPEQQAGRSLRSLKERRRKLRSDGYGQKYQDLPIDKKINYKADMFERNYPRGKSPRFSKFGSRIEREYGNLRDIIG